MRRKRSGGRRVATASKAANVSDLLGCAAGGLILCLIVGLVAWTIGLVGLLLPLLLILMWKECKNWKKKVKVIVSVLVIVCWLLLLPFVFQYFGWLTSGSTYDDNSPTPKPTFVVQWSPTATAIVPPTASPTDSPKPTAIPTNSPTAEPTAKPTPSPVPVLKKGMSGETVREMQSQLKRMGYLQEEPDGIFGSLTETAVKDFQKKNGLKVDGVAGSQTLTLLYSNKAKEQLWVWIPKSGKKHHANKYCSGMIDPEYVKLEEAERRGFSACGKDTCY